MKKILWVLTLFFAFTSMAFAAVNLNTATKEELDAVKGIGPAKAQAIIDYRSKNGPFKSVDDLKNVKGFGDKTVAKMRSELSVSGASSTKNEEKPNKADNKMTKDTEQKSGKEVKDEKKAEKKAEKESKEVASKEEVKADKKADKKAAKEAKKAEKAEKKAKQKADKEAKTSDKK